MKELRTFLARKYERKKGKGQNRTHFEKRRKRKRPAIEETRRGRIRGVGGGDLRLPAVGNGRVGFRRLQLQLLELVGKGHLLMHRGQVEAHKSRLEELAALRRGGGRRRTGGYCRLGGTG